MAMMTFSKLGRQGRLANQMFQIAGTIGIAVQSGQKYGFPEWINYDAKERFGSTEDIEVYKHFVNPLPKVDESLTYHPYPYFWGYRDINDPFTNWDFESHFQSEKYFAHCIDLIRFYFEMPGEVDHNEIAVHMRFGDYDGNYHPLPDPEYYRHAMAIMSRETAGEPIGIRIFSDDYAKAMGFMNETFPGQGGWYFTAESYIEEFKAMKRCKHFICGNSSYSLMAAILSDQPGKIVVCPKKWFGDHVDLETVDLYPKNSIVI